MMTRMAPAHGTSSTVPARGVPPTACRVRVFFDKSGAYFDHLPYIQPWEGMGGKMFAELFGWFAWWAFFYGSGGEIVRPPR